MITTYEHAVFLPLENLAREKTASGQRVSVVIPAVNEARTIGPIVAAIRTELADRHGLVDEIIVIDGGSTDATAREAAGAGAQVYPIDEIAPHLHAPRGKGAALWKSQFVAQGDIMVCVDGDIQPFDVRFVYGLLGPLLQDASIVMTKASYERPLVMGDAALPRQGGRITEILVRPLLSAFFPELARIGQPLSGEYAFRRRIVEQVGFSSGYGVEVGLLIDLYQRHGMGALAEVDMGIRCHRNRPVTELGRAAFGILQALMQRLERSGAVSVTTPLSPYMISPGPNPSSWEEFEIREIELPPRAAP